MRAACPECSTAVTYEEHGGLFSIRCAKCGWREEGTCNRELFPAVASPVLVAKADTPISAVALKTIREEWAPAQAKSLDILRIELASHDGFWLGNVPLYRAEELRNKLATTGIRLEELPHEEG